MTLDLTKFVALQIDLEKIGSVLAGKIGSNVALILDGGTAVEPDVQYTNFAIETYPDTGGIHPLSLWRRMTFDELRQLATALAAQKHHLPRTLDPTAFHHFVHQVEVELAHQPSERFTEARFAAINRDASGAIVAHLGLGIDMVGTVHDRRAALSFEQHVVPMHPGRFQRLARADRLSLAAAIDAFIRTATSPVDPLWQQLAHDASR
jgi:hypothetical protein